MSNQYGLQFFFWNRKLCTLCSGMQKFHSYEHSTTNVPNCQSTIIVVSVYIFFSITRSMTLHARDFLIFVNSIHLYPGFLYFEIITSIVSLFLCTRHCNLYFFPFCLSKCVTCCEPGLTCKSPLPVMSK